MRKLALLILVFAISNFFSPISYSAAVQSDMKDFPFDKDVIALNASDDKIQFNGTFLFPVKITIPITDSSGKRKFRTSARKFEGSVKFINEGDDFVPDQNGCFVFFSANDGSSICISEKALITTLNGKGRTDSLLLIGNGSFSLNSGGTTATGPIYLDTKGSIKKDSSGRTTSISLNGKVTGGTNGELMFGGNFKSTLAPAGSVLVITTQLAGSQELPPVTTAADGTAVFVVNLNDRGIRGTVKFSGLTGNSVSANICQGAAGTDGQVIISLEGGSGGKSGIWKIPDGIFLTGEQMSALQGGRLYVNVQSLNFPGGEIRGQLLPTVSVTQ